MKKYIAVLIMFTVLFGFAGKAQLRSSFEKKSFISANESMPYRFLKPEQINDSIHYPLILFLHSENQAGNDNEKQLNHFIMEFAKNKKRANFPAFIVAPQLPAAKSWTTAKSGNQMGKFAPAPNKELRFSMDLVKEIVNNFPVDTNRIYVIGISEGALAAWELAVHYPTEIAAVLSICGSCTAEQIPTNQFSTPVWAFIDETDNKFSVNEAKDLFNQLQLTNSNARLSIFQEKQLNCWNETLKVNELFNWLFEQAK